MSLVFFLSTFEKLKNALITIISSLLNKVDGGDKGGGIIAVKTAYKNSNNNNNAKLLSL